MNHRLALLCCLLSLLLVSAACSSPETKTAPPIPVGNTIDPVFREFYNYLGGQERLGAAIAPSVVDGGLTTQFIETGKLVFEPAAAADNRFRLEPLGVQMGISEPPVPPPSHPQLYYDNGHVIFPDFYALYEHLGAKSVGKPLTEVHFNLIRKRYEQYFANLGFYRLEGSEDVRLLSYGVWACPECDVHHTSRDAAIDVEPADVVHGSFRGFVDEKGTDFTGFPLQNASVAGDGKLEQILENIVLVTDPQSNPAPVNLRPLSEALQIPADPPRPNANTKDTYFFPVEGSDLGYEIPTYFWDYIVAHGGTPVFGPPITHYNQLSGVLYHQCFRNLCLLYDESLTEQARIRPEPFGYAYKMLYGHPDATPVPTDIVTQLAPLPTGIATAVVITVEPTLDLKLPPASGVTVTEVPAASGGIPTALPESSGGLPTSPATQALPTLPYVTPTVSNARPVREITMQMWGRYNVVSSQQAQEISVWITENDLPSQGAAVDLTVKLPSGEEATYSMPPTGANGQSSLVLPPISGPDSTLIPFRACYMTSADTRMCIADFFMIWNNP